MKCENCNSEMNEAYRFTDWHYEENDEYGTYEECLVMFNNAIKLNPTGRFSIYDVSECPKCEESKDEGVLFNENCTEYQL